jgi:hypothetical protein
MKPALVLAFSALSASAVLAAAPDPVVGTWRALPVQSAGTATMGVIGIPQVLTFTEDGQLWTAQRLPVRPPYRDFLLGRYTDRGGKVVAKGPSGETYAYELMKDGRLCVYPGPGMLPLAGPLKSQDADRQCYERLQAAV